MSDQSQGEDWWQAADGKWYPPEQHPNFDPGATQAMQQQPAGPPPTQAMPPAAPMPPPGGPVGPPPGGPIGPPPGARPNNNAKWIALGVVAALIIAIAAFLLLRDDDKKTNVAASGSSSSSLSTDTDSTSESSTSSSSRSSSSSSSSSSSGTNPGTLSKAEIDQRLVKAKDLGADFQDSTFNSNDNSPGPCGGASINAQVPPKIDTGNDASNGTALLEQEVLVYDSESDANQALQLFEESLNCPSPTAQGGSPLAASGPNDVSSDIDVKADDAIEYDVQTEEAQGKFIIVRLGNVIAAFQFVAQTGSDTSSLPNELDVVNLGLKRLLA
jgi:hypothetical protein